MTLKCSTANQIRWSETDRSPILRPSVPGNCTNSTQKPTRSKKHTKNTHKPKNIAKTILNIYIKKKKKEHRNLGTPSVSSSERRLCLSRSLRVLTVSVAAAWRSLSSVTDILLPPPPPPTIN